MIRVLVGAPVRQDIAVLEAHLKTITAQRVPGVELEYLYINDAEEDLKFATVELLEAYGIRHINAYERGRDAHYAVGDRTHHWTVGAFQHLAFEKQRILNEAYKGNYDAVWLVDTDLVVGPGTLRSLWECDKEIVSAVFWTQWDSEPPALPQVWVRHPYGFEGAGWKEHEFLRALARHELVRVRGLGACTLIRRSALEAGVGFHPLLEDLPQGGMWQGEDRHFCIRAERLHVPMWADAWPVVEHLYHPLQRTPEYIEETLKMLENSGRGDWVNVTLESLEESEFIGHKEHVRGRISNLHLLPEVEDALREMSVGEERIVRARFPAWSEIPHYRNQQKTFRVKLIDARTH